MEHPGIVVTHQNVLYTRKRQGEYPIAESDWERLKARIARVIPRKRVFEILAALAAGVAVQACFSLLAFYVVGGQQLSQGILIATWVMFFVSLALAPALYYLDRQQTEIITTSVQSVLDDMQFIEQAFHKPGVEESITYESVRAAYVPDQSSKEGS